MQTVPAELREIAGVLRRRGAALVAVAVAFGLISFALLAPAVSGTLALFLKRTGKASVGNFEIAAFLLSPTGFAAVVGVAALAITTVYLRLAAFQTALARPRLTWWQVILSLVRHLAPVLVLGVRQALWLFAVALPFAAFIGGVYLLLWRGKDLNALMVMKPPVFWWGAGIAGALLLVYALLALRLLIRWMFALPIVLFGNGATPAQAMKLSADMTRGGVMRLAGSLAGWLAIMLVGSFVVLLPLMWASNLILGGIGTSLAVVLPTTAAILAVHGAVAALLDVISVSSFSALVLSLYRSHGGSVPRPEGTGRGAAADPADTPAVRWSGTSVGLILLLLAVWAAHALLSLPHLNEDIEITAHRAGGGVAPENTIAALTHAIRDGAEWAEIDVQRTSDGALVIAHDYDFVRIGGPARKIADMTLEEVRTVDAGRHFDPQFAGEKIPTLDEFTSAAGAQIRLNIELKPHGDADVEPLTRGVVEAVRRAGIVDRCRLCSQSYEACSLPANSSRG